MNYPYPDDTLIAECLKELREAREKKEAKIPDFIVQNEGTVFILWPKTENALEWCVEHLPEDATRWGDSYVVEHRYIEDIVKGIRADGFIVA